MTMSCVAEEKPTSTAKHGHRRRGSRDGSDRAIEPEPEDDQAPGRRASTSGGARASRGRTGTRVRSMSGAHRNLNDETSVARLKKPMTSSDRPASRSQADSVSKIRKIGQAGGKPQRHHDERAALGEDAERRQDRASLGSGFDLAVHAISLRHRCHPAPG